MNSDDATRGEVVSASKAYMDSVVRLDAEAVAYAWADDGVIMPPAMGDFRGPQAIYELLSQVYPTMESVDASITSQEVEVMGDVATEVTHYEETLHGVDGSEVHLSGRMVFIWRRDAAGAWKIHRGIFNYDHPAEDPHS